MNDVDIRLGHVAGVRAVFLGVRMVRVVNPVEVSAVFGHTLDLDSAAVEADARLVEHVAELVVGVEVGLRPLVLEVGRFGGGHLRVLAAIRGAVGRLGGVSVGDVVGDNIHPLLLGLHAAGGDVESFEELHPALTLP